jgi:hypothetical protein
MALERDDDRRIVQEALAAAHEHGLPAGRRIVDHLADELQASRDEHMRLQRRLWIGFQMLERSNAIIARERRDDAATRH